MLQNRLRKYSDANANPANVANVHQLNAQTLATLATLQLATPVNNELIVSDESTNHWWLLHFKDGETRQACTWPHSTKAEMLKLNPDAVAAEPIAPLVTDDDLI